VDEPLVEPPSLDRTAWEELVRTTGGDKDFLADLLQTFFDDTPKELAVMRQSILHNRVEEFRRAAHSLKSNSATFGATRLSGMFRELEEMGKSGDLEGAEERLARAEAEYGRVRPLLEAERARM
jgi:HPt (histidine-containing phosphotransfer) domain-containing protein